VVACIEFHMGNPLSWTMSLIFTLSHSAINGNDNFYPSDVSQTPASVKYRPTVKFEKKLLVYICMSDKGIITLVFRKSGYAVNKEIYLNEFIKKKVVSYIGKHHSCGDNVFWPDLASSHSGKPVVDYMKARKNLLTKIKLVFLLNWNY